MRNLLKAEWWPVDKVIVSFLLFTTVLTIAWFPAIPGAVWLLVAHAAAIASLLAFRSNRAFHCWYPLPYVAACYKEMAILIPPIRGHDYDGLLSQLDGKLWRADPTLWLAA